VRFVIGLLLALCVAAVVGLSATWLATTRGLAFGAVSLGAWTANPKAGTSDIDPYARAIIARSGELPLGSGDGIAFVAQTDDAGRRLNGRCDVVLSGTTPAARFWTIALYDPEGRLVSNTLNRQGFTSQEIVRRNDGTFEIAVAPRPRAGNWLPTAAVERYMLVLRLYDAASGVVSRQGRETPMPSITVRSCP
jgi:hypothetical protein